MRIWIDPAKMAAYSLEPNEVSAAINEQSREAAAGQLGQNSGSSFEYIIKYVGKFNDKEQYDNIIIKSLPDGQNLMLKDVAKVEGDKMIEAAKQLHIEAQIVGRVEASTGASELLLQGSFGEVKY